MQNLAFKEDCLLRPTLDKTMRRIQLNCKIIPDLSELHNEPARLVEVITKLQITNNVQKEKLKDAQHLLHCLENDCEVCFPDEGAQLILCLVASELSLPVSVQFCCIFAVTKDKFGSFLKKLLITSIRS